MLSPENAHDIIRRSREYSFIFPEKALRGVTGEVRGRHGGGAVEYHDHTPYVPGDDLRHVDWMAYGRSENLVLKSFREDVAPRSEICIDLTASMGLYEDKEEMCRSIALFCAEVLAHHSIRPSLWICSDNLHRCGPDRTRTICEHPCRGGMELSRTVNGEAFGRCQHALRILISDFLFPHDPEYLLSGCASRAAGLLVFQVLHREEADPSLHGGVTLEDCESRERAGLYVTSAMKRRYRERFSRLCRALEDTCRRIGAGYVRVDVPDSLDTVINQAVAEGFIDPNSHIS